MQSTRAKLARVFSQVLEMHNDTDSLSASMKTLPNWDSMAHISLILSVEQEFRISFTPEEAASITSFTDMERLVNGKLIQSGGLGSAGDEA